eukprot:1153297-Pelagomonas_calceolata.AAC.10
MQSPKMCNHACIADGGQACMFDSIPVSSSAQGVLCSFELVLYDQHSSLPGFQQGEPACVTAFPHHHP